jgi:N-acetyl-anhydromuramyl-L-alanine amidase AmpD
MYSRAIPFNLKGVAHHEPRRPGVAVDVLLLHATVGSAAASLSWFRNPASRVSIHYLVDKQGRVYSLTPESLTAWHAGRASWQGRTNLNACSIGVELENRNDGKDPYPQAQLDSLVDLARDLRTRWPIQHYLTHAQVAVPRGRKSDPRGFPMTWFLSRLNPGDGLDEYVVITDAAPVYQGPDCSFPLAGTLPRGTRVLVDVHKPGGWVHMAHRPPDQWDLGFIHLDHLAPAK